MEYAWNDLEQSNIFPKLYSLKANSSSSSSSILLRSFVRSSKTLRMPPPPREGGRMFYFPGRNASLEPERSRLACCQPWLGERLEACDGTEGQGREIISTQRTSTRESCDLTNSRSHASNHVSIWIYSVEGACPTDRPTD